MVKRKKKSAWQQSEFGKINAKDLINGVYHGLAAIGGGLVAILGDGKVTTEEWKILLGTFIGAYFLSIIKGAAKNSKGELLKKEDAL